MPFLDPVNEATGPLFYSYNTGPLHVILMSAYSDAPTPSSPQVRASTQAADSSKGIALEPFFPRPSLSKMTLLPLIALLRRGFLSSVIPR